MSKPCPTLGTDDDHADRGCPTCRAPRKTLAETFEDLNLALTVPNRPVKVLDFYVRLREADALEERLPCGHRRVDNDDTYGGCVLCGFHRGEIEAEKEYDALSERYARLREYAGNLLSRLRSLGHICPACGFFMHSGHKANCGLAELLKEVA